MLKKHVQENLDSLRTKISDKGEKEEKMANDRIVAVIGFLASFQVLSEILPIFDPNTVKIIRILFLALLIPLLVIIWYSTSYNNKKKIKIAERLENKFNLIKQKQVMTYNLVYFTQSSNQEMMELSKQELEKQITLLKQKINEIEISIKKLDESGM